jgi:hypothetical protein
MSSWLVWTGLLEWCNIFLFGGLLWLLARRNGGLVGPATLVSYLTAALILLQGGGYWLAKRWCFGPTPPGLTTLRLLYGANLLLLLVFPATLLVLFASRQHPATGDLLLGSAIYLFAVGEFLHYFIWKINMRGRELRRALRTGHLPPARFRREYARAKAQAA